MKKTLLLLFALLAVCGSLFAVTYAEGKTLDVFPDTVISGSSFSIQLDANMKNANLSWYGNANTLMIMGDKTGSIELKIGTNGIIDYDNIVTLFESNTELYAILAVDKDSVAKAKFDSISSSEFISRLNDSVSTEYIVGDTGPAGGIIFYDKGYYSDGWRYLEAAPADLRNVSGTPSVDKLDPWYDFGVDSFIFGFYRETSSNLFVNGTSKYNKEDCTGKAVGTGKKNTELLITAMDSSAYDWQSGTGITSSYAAKLCSDLVYNGFDDWFLPSIDELNLMYANLKKKGKGDFASENYWSSSESNYDSKRAWVQGFISDMTMDYYRSSEYRVRPIREF